LRVRDLLSSEFLPTLKRVLPVLAPEIDKV
jgi:hypothetical protein